MLAADGSCFGELSDGEHWSAHQWPEQPCVVLEGKGSKDELPVGLGNW